MDVFGQIGLFEAAVLVVLAVGLLWILRITLARLKP